MCKYGIVYLERTTAHQVRVWQDSTYLNNKAFPFRSRQSKNKFDKGPDFLRDFNKKQSEYLDFTIKL